MPPEAMESQGGTDFHLQSMEDPILEQMNNAPKQVAV